MKEVWYPKNRQKHIGYVRRLKQEVIAFIEEHKKKGFCVDCGFRGNKYPQVLDFDHIEGKSTKKFEIASWRKSVLSISAVKTEMQKCELVCANCHRIRTVSRLKVTNR